MEKTNNVLVTGGAGFIGSHLIEHILRYTDWDIVCLDRLDVSGNLNRIYEVISGNQGKGFEKRFKFVYHDLKAEINTNIAHELGKPSLIFHLAASSHVEDSIANPLLYVQDNVLGSLNLLNYAKTLDNLDYIQMFSTDEVFGYAPDGVAYKEWDVHKPRNPYSAAKSGADQLSYAFHITYGLPLVISNCMNVIGERQDNRKYVPLVMNKLLNNEKLYVHSYPGGKRPGSRKYVHARNVASACLFLQKNFTAGERYNFGGQIELDNLELAQKIAKMMNKELIYELVDFHGTRPGHDLRYDLDDTKLREMGFEYPVSFDESLEKTIQWTLANPRWLQ